MPNDPNALVKHKITLMAKNSMTVLKAMPLLKEPALRDARHRVQTVAKHAQQNLSVDSVDQIKLRFQRIVSRERLASVAQAGINSMERSSLSKAQQDYAIGEIQSAQRFTDQDMDQDRNVVDIMMTCTSGINAINGALSKYLADGKISAVQQVTDVAKAVRSAVDRQKTSVKEVQSLAHREIHSIQAKGMDQLNDQSNFIDLVNASHQAIHQLKAVGADYRHVLNNLSAYEDFVKQIKSTVAAVRLSASAKSQLSDQIKLYHQATLGKVKRGSKLKGLGQILDTDQKAIYDAVIQVASIAYQQRVQALALNNVQKYRLTQKLQEVTTQAGADNASSANLRHALHRFQLIINKGRSLISYDQVAQTIEHIRSKINGLSGMSDTDREYLRNQMGVYTHRIQRQLHKPTDVKSALRKFINQQIRLIRTGKFRRALRVNLIQIKLSHLPKDRKQRYSHCLTQLQKGTTKSIMMKAGMKKAITSDVTANQQLLRELNAALVKNVQPQKASVLRPKLRTITDHFNQTAKQLSKLTDVDHAEQRAEEHACYALYKASDHYDAAKDQVLRDQCYRIRDQIEVSILDANWRQMIEDLLSQSLNIVLVTLSTGNQPKIALVDAARVSIKDSLTSIATDYARELDGFIDVVSHQLMAYTDASFVYHLNKVRSRVTMQLENAQDLKHLEAVKQRGTQRLVKLMNTVVDKYDPEKAKAHRQIQHGLAVTQSQLHNAHDMTIANRVLEITNSTDLQINCRQRKYIQDLVEACRQSIKALVMGRYLNEWRSFVSRARADVQKLTVPESAKQQATQSVDEINRYVISTIKQAPQDELKMVVGNGMQESRAIVISTGYLDPQKSLARSRLNQQLQALKTAVSQHRSGYAQTKTLSRLTRLNDQINLRIIQSDDQQLKATCQRAQKDLANVQARLMRPKLPRAKQPPVTKQPVHHDWPSRSKTSKRTPKHVSLMDFLRSILNKKP